MLTGGAKGAAMKHMRWTMKSHGGLGKYMGISVMVGLLLISHVLPAASGTIELPRTGQITCYNSSGTEISCTGTGQDGDILAGIAWPSERFETYNVACIVDNLTGLMWLRNTSSFSARAWEPAVVNLRIIMPSACGFADWRIPNINELHSLINAEQPDSGSWLFSQGFIFPLTAELPFWTSTSSAGSPTLNAWVVDMVDGSVYPDNKGEPYYLWPVRGTSNPPRNVPPGQIAETGQRSIYSAYDDAYFAITPTLNVGVPWPSPRFTDSGDCVTDNLTGLTWSKYGNLDGLKTWSGALAYTSDLTGCGYTDWRLPNSKELLSLIDRSKSGPALPAFNPFVGVQFETGNVYWTSTSYAFDPSQAWTVDMGLGGLAPLDKDSVTAFVWPVRGGKTKPYVLTVMKEGSGSGKVSAPGLSCAGQRCTGEYASYDEVTLTAKANAQSVFMGWGGEGCNGSMEPTCPLAITGDLTITATFLLEFKISIAPKSLNFKNLKKDTPSAGLTVVITNAGAEPLQIVSVDIAGDDASVFSQINDCPPELIAGELCTVTVTATSDNYDNRRAQLQITSNDPKKPLSTVSLKAKAKPPKINKKPGTLNFGKVSVGVSSDNELIIKNKGLTDLTFGTIDIGGDNPGDFSFTPAACPSLATDETCTLTVTFAPSALGKRTAVLNIPSNDPKKQPFLTVNLKGTGE